MVEARGNRVRASDQWIWIDLLIKTRLEIEMTRDCPYDVTLGISDNNCDRLVIFKTKASQVMQMLSFSSRFFSFWRS
jgi:hypothetical protein